MPQLVLRFPGSFGVCYSDFLCVFEIATAGVTDLRHNELNICFQCRTKCILCFNYRGSGIVPIVLPDCTWPIYFQYYSSIIMQAGIIKSWYSCTTQKNPANIYSLFMGFLSISIQQWLEYMNVYAKSRQMCSWNRHWLIIASVWHSALYLSPCPVVL